jgi:endonuclease YncB( thermonuclease family)
MELAFQSSACSFRDKRFVLLIMFPSLCRILISYSTALKDQTIHIRIAGADAPEAAHFGKPAQPGADEALAWLKGMIDGKSIWCQLVRKDQYSRVVSGVSFAKETRVDL